MINDDTSSVETRVRILWCWRRVAEKRAVGFECADTEVSDKTIEESERVSETYEYLLVAAKDDLKSHDGWTIAAATNR